MYIYDTFMILQLMFSFLIPLIFTYQADSHIGY